MDPFWDKVDRRSAAECWDWTAHKSRGYGSFKAVRAGRRVTVSAHRLAYELAVGLIPAGLEIDHLCRNKACCNPLHLEPVTSRENSRRWQLADGVLAGATHCPRGHSYSGDNLYVNPQRRRVCRECNRAACRAQYVKRKLRASVVVL